MNVFHDYEKSKFKEGELVKMIFHIPEQSSTIVSVDKLVLPGTHHTEHFIIIIIIFFDLFDNITARSCCTFLFLLP